MKRVFLIVLDSLGIGEQPDAAAFFDQGSNTLKAIRSSKYFDCPNLEKLGLFNIDTVGGGVDEPIASFARLKEESFGKDTIIGHWEIAGLKTERPLPTYPQGFPTDIIKELEYKTNRKIICNKPYSGTEVIKDYGREHVKTGALIVYTSADSVLQIAAHEDVVPVEELYRYCITAREIMSGDNGVGRIIARPFLGDYPYVRTKNRHDFSLKPPKKTMLDLIKTRGFSTIAVGKIYDIFAEEGITEYHLTTDNLDGIRKTLALMDKEWQGLCFVNLVDFDMKFGHRNDIDGYAKAMTECDKNFGEILERLKEEDLLIITADHGCDPSTPSTDHSREYVPMLIYGDKILGGINLNTLDGFYNIGATILDYLDVDKGDILGESFLKRVAR